MERQVTMEEISDGKLYGANDMVRADCQDCKGCSACCQGMGSSIMLDPLDIYRLTTGLGQDFEQLVNTSLELGVVDGMIFPNLKMAGPQESCSFLNAEGRCSIHAIRPGICRLFPLGRKYENGSFQYFLQVHECKNENKTKVKVKKWVDTPNLKKNEQYISDWHYFIKELQERCKGSMEETFMKQMNMYILNEFFLKPYDGNRDFYEQFYERFHKCKEEVAIDLSDYS